jgi:hypothetical protein
MAPPPPLWWRIFQNISGIFLVYFQYISSIFPVFSGDESISAAVPEELQGCG